MQQSHPERAAEAFARGLKTAPEDPKLLLHYSQALRRLDRKEEAHQASEKFRLLGARSEQRAVEAWAFDFYQQPPSQQRARYIAGLRSEIDTLPEDASLRVSLGEALLAEGKHQEAVVAFREAVRLTSIAEIPARCGRDLLAAGLPAAGAEFLRSARSKGASSERFVFDLAIADFHASGAAQALADLETVPEGKRNAEYYLLRAEILDASGEVASALDALARGGVSAQPVVVHPDFYLEWSVVLLMHGQQAEALRVVRAGERAAPGNRELLLAEALANSLLGQFPAALSTLARIEKQWPEWSRLYLAKGAVLADSGDYPGAMGALKIAATMGPEMGPAACYLTSTLLRRQFVSLKDVSGAAADLLRLDPDHPYCRFLDGAVAFAGGDYEQALLHVRPAALAHPRWKEAHVALRDIYRAMGRQDEAAKEELAAAEAQGARMPMTGGTEAAAVLLGVKLQIPAALGAGI